MRSGLNWYDMNGDSRRTIDSTQVKVLSSHPSMKIKPLEDELAKRKPASTRGTLQCFWKEEKPLFVFSYDEAKLTATMCKSSLSDCEYIFCSRRKYEEMTVGTMTVSSSFSCCSDHCSVIEREFVLISDDTVPNHTRSIKRRTRSRFCGSVTIPNDWLADEESGSQSNHEAAAIIVRDHVYTSIDAGWGMKFLSKFKEPKCLSGRTVEVIVPAGPHGGPTGGPGPIGLVERWKSGGICDCDGWDLGCPLTIYSDSVINKSSTVLDLSIQGSQQCESAMVVEIIGDGLYSVSYGPKFSGLLAFSVAVAHFHALGRLTRPTTMYRT